MFRSSKQRHSIRSASGKSLLRVIESDPEMWARVNATLPTDFYVTFTSVISIFNLRWRTDWLSMLHCELLSLTPTFGQGWHIWECRRLYHWVSLFWHVCMPGNSNLQTTWWNFIDQRIFEEVRQTYVTLHVDSRFYFVRATMEVFFIKHQDQ